MSITTCRRRQLAAPIAFLAMSIASMVLGLSYGQGFTVAASISIGWDLFWIVSILVKKT